MAIFLEGNELNLAIEDLIRDAKHELIIVSPYIKFHGRIKDLMEDLKEFPEVNITIIYGKSVFLLVFTASAFLPSNLYKLLCKPELQIPSNSVQ
jgi:hypothetical protein